MIPKIIHITWKSKDILTSTSPLAVHGVQNLIKLNPDWDIQFSDDSQVDSYLQEHLAAPEYALIRDFHIVAKTDVWRLLKIYREGGVYVDLDRLCNISFNNIIEDHVKCILPTCGDHDFSHDLMISAPENP